VFIGLSNPPEVRWHWNRQMEVTTTIHSRLEQTNERII
jgi:hypothetical protein